MTIQEQVVEAMKQAMRDKRIDVRDLLRVVIGEFNRDGKEKEVSDERATSIMKKMHQNAIEFGNVRESQILGMMLPRDMPDAKLEVIIETYCKEHDITNMRGMGQVMGFLKKEYNGAYNGTTAAEMTKKLLS